MDLIVAQAELKAWQRRSAGQAQINSKLYLENTKLRAELAEALALIEELQKQEESLEIF